MAFSWNDWYSDKTHGGHRQQTEDFLAKEAREKLYHLRGGESLLDFGCGSAELLVYYTKKYSNIVGADFSKSLLENAKKRIDAFNCADKIILVEADDTNIWQKMPQNFDEITSCGVIQHFNYEQIDRFIEMASQRLNANGRIVLFDIMESRIFYLVELGLFSKAKISKMKILKRMVVHFLSKKYRMLKGLPSSIQGDAYQFEEIERIAGKYGLSVEIVWSMYYEYRYHAILSRRSL
jgi:cyclopropane-fatty-acyl-phospholipid synthase